MLKKTFSVLLTGLMLIPGYGLPVQAHEEMEEIPVIEMTEDSQTIDPHKDENYISYWYRYQENGKTIMMLPGPSIYGEIDYKEPDPASLIKDRDRYVYEGMIENLNHGYDFVQDKSTLENTPWSALKKMDSELRNDYNSSPGVFDANNERIEPKDQDYCWTIPVKKWDAKKSAPKGVQSGLPLNFFLALTEKTDLSDESVYTVNVDDIDALKLNGSEQERLKALNETLQDCFAWMDKTSDIDIDPKSIVMKKPISLSDLVEIKAGNDVIAYTTSADTINYNVQSCTHSGATNTDNSENNKPENKKFTADDVCIYGFINLDGALPTGTPNVTVRDGVLNFLTEGKDYTYTVTQPATKFGDTGKVQVTGKGAYASVGSVEQTYTLYRNLKEAKVTSNSSDGYVLDKAPSTEQEAVDALKKIVKVTWGDTTLKYGDDYTISISALPKGKENGKFEIISGLYSNYKFWSQDYSEGWKPDGNLTFSFSVKTPSNTTNSSTNSSTNKPSSGTSGSSATLNNISLEDIGGITTKDGSLKDKEREALEEYVNESSKFNPNGYDFTVKAASVSTDNKGKSTITMTVTAKLKEDSVINLVFKNLGSRYEDAFIEENEDGFVGFEETEKVVVKDTYEDGKEVIIQGITVEDAFRVNGTIDSVGIKRILTKEGYDVAKLDFSSKTSSEDTFNVKSLTAPISIEVSAAKKPTVTVPVGAGSGSNDTPVAPAPLAPQTPTVAKKKTYRFFNKLTGEHFYTTSETERDQLEADNNWSNEGQGWIAPEFSDFPIYRLCNPNTGEHHYTLDKNEYDTLQTLGWNGEGIGLYSADVKDSNAVQLHRLYNPNAKDAGSHHYTVDENEKNTLVAQGWKYEGIAWHGLKSE